MLIVNQNSQFKDEVLQNLFLSAKELFKINGSVELTFVDDKTIKHLNNEHAGNNYATDVLSWAYQENADLFEHELLGEIYISLETAQKQAQEKGHSLKFEVQYLLAHGLLHVIGYDHQTQSEKVEMDSLTDKIIKLANQN